MRLYKYFNPARIDVVSNLKIRFTPPLAFNDPFEIRPWIPDGIPKEKGIVSAERLYNEKGITSTERQFLISTYEDDTDKAIWPHIWERVSDWIASTSLCLSLTESPDNLLMWAHYAQNHEGFLLGLDADHPHLKGRGHGIYRLSQIVYAHKRPNVTFDELTLENHFFTKSSEWSYEREWRLFEMAENATEIVNTDQLPIHLFDLPPEAVLELRIGCRASDGFKREILAKVEANGDLANIEIKQAVINQSRYALDFISIES